MSRIVKPAENKLLLGDSLHNAYHTSFRNVRTSGSGISLRFEPLAFLRKLKAIAYRLLKIRAKETFKLSDKALRHMTETSGKPYVLHVICNMEIGGSQKIILDMFEHMSCDYSMKILTGHIPFYTNYKNIPIVELNTAGDIEGFLRAEKPRIIHMHYWGLEEWLKMFLDVAFALKSELGCRIIENSNNPIKAYYDERIDHIAHVSRFVLDLQGDAIPLEKQSVVYPGVDEKQFDLLSTRKDLRSAGMVYRLTNDKISADTIELLIKLCKAVPDILIHIIGDGPNLRHFIERAKECGVRHNIIFTGFVPYEKLSWHYEQFNVFLAPVHHESYGVVMPYALLKGNPIVAYDVDAVWELLGDDNPVVTSEEEFISHTVRLIEDTAKRDDLVRSNRTRAEGMFTLKRMIEGYDALYKDSLNGQPIRVEAPVSRKRRALVHIVSESAQLPYYTGLFGYSSGHKDSDFVSRAIELFEADSALITIDNPKDLDNPMTARTLQTWQVTVSLNFTGKEDEDCDLLYAVLKRLRAQQDCLITLAFDYKAPCLVSHLYRAESASEFMLFPPQAVSDDTCEISVCMATYNRKDILLLALRALDEDYKALIATHPELAIEVHIVDDSSTDGTDSALSAIKGELSFNMTVMSIPNSGPATARNKAFQVARGKIVLFIDDDKIVERGFLKSHYQFHINNPDLQAAALGFVDWPPYMEKTFLMDHVVSEFGLEQFAYCIIDRFNNTDLPYDFFVTANVSVKRDLLRICGGFYEPVFRDAMWEDTELGWRLQGMGGMRLHYVPSAVLYHDHLLTLADFVRRQFKVGQYVSRLSDFAFMKPRRNDAIEVPKHFPAVKSMLETLDIGDIMNLAKHIAGKEQDMLKSYGEMPMHLLYKNILLAAYLTGMRDQSPLKIPGFTEQGRITNFLVQMLSIIDATHQTFLYYDNGDGFSENTLLRQRATLTYKRFSLRFDLKEAGAFKRLRWDPLHLTACRVKIDTLEYINDDGSRLSFPIERITHNGLLGSNRFVEFYTIDPQMLFPLKGNGGVLVIEGEWETMSANTFNMFMQRFNASTEAAFLYYDTGGGFTQQDSMYIPIHPATQFFEINYDLSEVERFKQLRWDPLCDSHCCVHFESIEYKDPSGLSTAFDPAKTIHNGRNLKDGWIELITYDPAILFPGLTGKGGSLTLKGEMQQINTVSDECNARNVPSLRYIIEKVLRRLKKIVS